MTDIEAIIAQLDRKKLAADEQETTISQNADDRSIWRVWTNDLVMIRRLDRLGAKPATYDAYGVGYDLDKSQISLRRKRKLTAEQRAELRERGQRLIDYAKARKRNGAEPK